MRSLETLKFTSDHEWLELKEDVATMGVTAFAAESLGDIVYVGMMDPGAKVAAGEPCGEIESTKSVSDLIAPTSCEIVAVNEEVVADPSFINSDPFGRGWILRLRLFGDMDLMDADEYAELIGVNLQ